MRPLGGRRPPTRNRRTASAAANRAVVRASQRLPSPRRVRRRLLWVLGLILIAECVVALCTSPALWVRHVRVQGAQGLTPAETRETQARVAVPPQTNLLRARTGEIAAALKRLPWVDDAVVARRPLNALEVRLKPRVAVALLTTPNGAWEIDAKGVPIRPTQAAEGLPHIEITSAWKVQPGVPIDHPGVAGALLVARETAGNRLVQMAKIEVDQNADICLNMQNEMVIRLGPVDDLPAKLALLRRICEEAPGLSAEVQTIDLRCPEAPVCIPRSAEREGSEKATASPRQRNEP